MSEFACFTSDFEDRKQPYFANADRPLTICASLSEADESIDVAVIPPVVWNTEGHEAVYTGVSLRNLGSIATHGLLVEKNSVGSNFPATFERAFLRARPDSLSQFDRTRVVYARPYRLADEPLMDSSEGSNQTCFLEIFVPPEKVLVADQGIVDKSMSYYRSLESSTPRSKLEDSTVPLAEEYWGTAVTLDRYLSADTRPLMSFPEVLIPFSVSPELIQGACPAIEQ